MNARKHRRQAGSQYASGDSFNRRARQQGYRSRAVFKLIEIDRRDRLIRTGMRVLDLGAAPGGWSQYVVKKVGPTGTVVAVDLVPMEPLEKVHFMQGDCTNSDLQQEYLNALGGAADLVLSDMAPNITGIRQADQANILRLLDNTLTLSSHVLKRGGNLLMKVFEGPELKGFRSMCEQRYGQVQVRKPAASRSKSREYYLLAKSLLHPAPRIG